MALEPATYINQLVAANPSGADRVHQGDDHIRLIKAALLATFPNLTGPMTLTQAQLNSVFSVTVPIGFIGLWSGPEEDCPEGWAVCKGQTVARTDGDGNITLPDLRGRVAIGVSGSYPLGTTVGAETVGGFTTSSNGSHSHSGSTGSAGEHSHGGGTGSTSLSVDQMPAHSHGNGVADDNTAGIMWRGTKATTGIGTGIKNDGSGPLEGITESVGSGNAHNHSLNSDGSHSHGISIGDAGGHSHSLDAFSVVQPGMGLHYIMKI